MLFVNEGFTFRNFLVDAITIFVFVVTFWLLITVFMDLFRRHDISGWVKAVWVIALIIVPLPCRACVPDHARPWDGRTEHPASSTSSR